MGAAMRIWARLKALATRRRGAGAVEYGLVLGLIAAVALAAIGSTGARLSTLFGTAANEMRSGDATLPPAEGGGNGGSGGSNDSGAGSQVFIDPPSAVSDVTAPDSTGTPATFTVTNIGTGASGIVTQGLATTTGAFAIVGGSCTAGEVRLAPGATCTVIVARTATANDDARTAVLTVGFAQGINGSATVSGQSTGWASAMAASPSGVQEAAIVDGHSPGPAAVFTLANTGNTASQSLAASFTAGAEDFAVTGGNCPGANLAPQQSCTLAISRIASGNGPEASGTLHVAFAAGGAADLQVHGAATGWSGATMLSPGSVTAEIGDGRSPGTAHDFIVTNTTAADSGTVTAALTGADASGFDIVTNTCGASLGAGASCQVSVARVASDNEPVRSAVLQVSFAAGPSASATVSGASWGWASAGSISPGSATVAIEDGHSPGPATTFTISNTGTKATGALSAAISAGSDYFQLTGAGSCTAAGLGIGQSCTLAAVRIAGANDATRSGTLQVSFANGGGASAALSGRAAGFASALVLSPESATAEITGGNSPGNAAPFTLSNTGTLASGTISATLQQGGSWFQIGGGSCDLAAGIAAGQSCTVGVQRTAGDNDGNRSATLQIAFANGGAGSATISGAASGWNSALSLSPGSGSSAITGGASPGPTASFIALNSGNKATGAIAVSLEQGGSWFEIASDSCDATDGMAVGQQCSIGVRRISTINDPNRSATLRVRFANGGEQTASVSGAAAGFTRGEIIGVAADDDIVMLLNGTEILRSSGYGGVNTTSVVLNQGQNVVTARLTNSGGGPAGILIRQGGASGTCIAPYGIPSGVKATQTIPSGAQGAWVNDSCWYSFTKDDGSDLVTNGQIDITYLITTQ